MSLKEKNFSLKLIIEKEDKLKKKINFNENARKTFIFCFTLIQNPKTLVESEQHLNDI